MEDCNETRRRAGLPSWNRWSLSLTVRLLAINVGVLQPIPGAKRQAPTGIFKRPVGSGPVMVHVHGLEGDQIGSTKYHGGPDQAVCIYSAEDYAWWEQTLGRDLPFGIFGENLTVSSMGEHPARVGDLWQIGEVTLQLSAPRIPCATLAARMKEPTFVKTFAKANRGGAFARVLRPGHIDTSMPVTMGTGPCEHPTVDELFALWHQRHKDPDLMRRALASPLASLARADVEKWMARLARDE